MPDITMCKGGSCSIKEKCYRFKAFPSEFRQSYFKTAPFVIRNGRIECVHFIKT